MSKKEDNESTEFPKKWNNVLKSLPEFKEIADAASTDDLKKIIVECEGNIYTIEKEVEGNDKINGMKEMLKDHLEPFRDGKKVQMTKIQYALFLLESKGVELDNK